MKGLKFFIWHQGKASESGYLDCTEQFCVAVRQCFFFFRMEQERRPVVGYDK